MQCLLKRWGKPSDYKFVEYWDSDTAWAGHTDVMIVTGYKPKLNTRLVVDMDVYSYNSYRAYLFGIQNSVSSGTSSHFYCSFEPGENYISFSNCDITDNGDTTRNLMGRHTYDLSRNSFKIDGASIPYDRLSSAGDPYTSALEIAICNVHRHSSSGDGYTRSYGVHAKVYSFQIYEGSSLVMDCVPRLQKSTGITYMYDKINKKQIPITGW